MIQKILLFLLICPMAFSADLEVPDNKGIPTDQLILFEENAKRILDPEVMSYIQERFNFKPIIYAYMVGPGWYSPDQARFYEDRAEVSQCILHFKEKYDSSARVKPYWHCQNLEKKGRFKTYVESSVTIMNSFGMDSVVSFGRFKIGDYHTACGIKVEKLDRLANGRITVWPMNSALCKE